MGAVGRGRPPASTGDIPRRRGRDDGTVDDGTTDADADGGDDDAGGGGAGAEVADATLDARARGDGAVGEGEDGDDDGRFGGGDPVGVVFADDGGHDGPFVEARVEGGGEDAGVANASIRVGRRRREEALLAAPFDSRRLSARSSRHGASDARRQGQIVKHE